MTEPQVEQRWRSKDPRDSGRVVTVIEVSSTWVTVRWVRRSNIRRASFAKRYELVERSPKELAAARAKNVEEQ